MKDIPTRGERSEHTVGYAYKIHITMKDIPTRGERSEHAVGHAYPLE